MRVMCHHFIIAYLQTLNNKSEMCNVYQVYCSFSEMELQVLCLLIRTCSQVVSPFSSYFPPSDSLGIHPILYREGVEIV